MNLGLIDQRLNIFLVQLKKKSVSTYGKETKIEICEFDNLESYLVDGVHFGNEGYKKIAEIWSKSILKLQE